MERAHPIRELLSPLAVAAYAGWTAVFVQAGAQLAARDPGLGLAARASMLLFLVGFVRELLQDERTGLSASWGLGLMLVSVFVLIALGPAATSPILGVVLAACLGARLGDRALMLALIALLAVLGALMRLRWGFAGPGWWIQLAAFGSFTAFAAMAMRQYARADALAGQLRETNAGLLSTRSLLSETARDSERLRLSRELHDVAGHKLTALKLNLSALAREPRFVDHPQVATALALSDELLQDLRALVQQFRQHDGIDLREAFDRLAQALPRPKVQVDIAAATRVPGPGQAEALLRVAQEGLTNSMRHGGANRAWLKLAADGPALELCLDDDGRVRWPIREGNGLTGMRERIEALDGRVHVERSPRGGMRIRVRLPLEPVQ